MSEADHDQTEPDPTEPVPEHEPSGPPETSDDGPVETVVTDAEDRPPVEAIDVAGIEADLDGVQAALARLADGTYWTDEVTGEPIAPDVLAADPLARRA